MTLTVSSESVGDVGWQAADTDAERRRRKGPGVLEDTRYLTASKELKTQVSEPAESRAAGSLGSVTKGQPPQLPR